MAKFYGNYGRLKIIDEFVRSNWGVEVLTGNPIFLSIIRILDLDS
jgi:hypothetical protein